MRRWRWIWLLALLCWPLAALAADAHTQACVLSVQAARAPDGLRPAAGWEPVSLPDNWTKRWPGYEGTVWYRIDWERGCAGAGQGDDQTGLFLGGIRMAGEVFVNGDLLWRDASLAEPLSRSWDTPRWWLLPASTLHAGRNTVWVRVAGVAALSPGLGDLRIGPAAQMAGLRAARQWRQRTVYIFSVGLLLAIGCLFGAAWCLWPVERAFGWFALTLLAWSAYLLALLATSSWPFASALTLSRLGIVAFVLFALFYCLFIWRVIEQHRPRLEQALCGLAALSVAAVLLAPRAAAQPVLAAAQLGSSCAFFASCLQFQWYAWHPREGRCSAQHIALALCCLSFVVVGAHDLPLMLRYWHVEETWTSISAPITTVVMSLLLGLRLADSMRRIDRFNQKLDESVARARADLAQALEREHCQALEHAKLQERMDIAHDLHDNLGSILVRSIAQVEQAREALPNERTLSLLKALRNDLRQVIDYGSSGSAQVPATPVQWIAPLRYRFTDILDEMDISSRWDIADRWHKTPPSALQCLGLTRLMEEALSNVIKHSRAHSVRVQVLASPHLLTVRIEDDGRGFDVQAVRSAGLSVGMRSMDERIRRMGARLTVESGPDGSMVCAELPLECLPGVIDEAPAAQAAPAPREPAP